MFNTLARWIDVAAPTRAPERVRAVLRAPEIRGVAVAEALEFLDGEVADYLALVDKFRTSSRGAIAEIRLALASGRTREAERLAHSLNGVSAALGAKALRTTVRALEDAIRKSAETVPELLDEAELTLADLFRAIDEAV